MASPAPTKPSLQARALRWLSTREHSRHELRAKLLRVAEGDGAPAEVEALLDRLAASGYLNEARFVESRVHAREARFGNRRIEGELRRHGAAPDASTLDRLRRSELERARQVWRRKFGAQVAATPAERARQMRFLAARGFTAEVVRRVVRGVDDDPPAGASDPD
jgi:regulatory protein